jgi:hypothetical protein
MKMASELRARRRPEPFPRLSGFNVGYLAKTDYYASDRFDRDVSAMADLGVTWVSLMVMLMQETFYSTRITRDFAWTPSDRDLERAVVRCQKRGLRVLLKPVIDCLDSSWRGRIAFPDGDQQIQGVVTDYWSRWFESNRAAMTYYARLSHDWGVEAFTVAQELLGTDLQTRHWLETVAAVRNVFPGWLCVNAQQRRMESAFLTWVRTLDAFGISNYHAVAADHPDAESVCSAMATEVTAWDDFQSQIGLPIYWAECGCRSVARGARAPSDYQSVGPYDGEVQAAWIEGLLRAYADQPWWAGFQVWKWDEQQDRPHYRQSGGDTGFTVAGKPAEAVIARWCRKTLCAGEKTP